MSDPAPGQGKLPATLLLGGDGMLGRQWRRELDRLAVAYEAPTQAEADLTRPETLAAHIPSGGVVVNCAAFTDVDACEDEAHEPTAAQVNGSGVGELARQCRDAGAYLLHYSTDYVFDGRANRPYAPDDPIDPINAYGRSKALGERLIRESGCEHLIVRTSWLYAPWGRNFARTMARLLRDKPELRVVDDQRGCPTSVEHLAGVSLRLWQAGQGGTFHVTDGGQCTWFDFAVAIGEHLSAACRVERCTTEAFPRPAERPAYSVLDTSGAEAVVGPMPGWQATLPLVLERMEPIES